MVANSNSYRYDPVGAGRRETNNAEERAYSTNSLSQYTLKTQCQSFGQYHFDSCGNTTSTTGVQTDVNPFRFSTKYTDSETGLLYYGYRNYQPETGRWTSRDPAEEKSGYNLYVFSLNSAVLGFDPVGLSCVKYGNYSSSGRWVDVSGADGVIVGRPKIIGAWGLFHSPLIGNFEGSCELSVEVRISVDLNLSEIISNRVSYTFPRASG